MPRTHSIYLLSDIYDKTKQVSDRRYWQVARRGKRGGVLIGGRGRGRTGTADLASFALFVLVLKTHRMVIILDFAYEISEIQD